jgi:hypothetical protein
MENKITPTTRARIFGMFLGQTFQHDKDNAGIISGVYTDSSGDAVFNQEADKSGVGTYDIERCCIEVTPLHSISDEDAIEVAKMAMWYPGIEEFTISEVTVAHKKRDIIRLDDCIGLHASCRCWEGWVTINFDGTVVLKEDDDDGKTNQTSAGSIISQFLLQRGYALPILIVEEGKPVVYSVQELVEEGVYSLKTK